MPCRTIRDLLNQLEDFHHRLAKLLADKALEVNQPKTKLLLDYMSRHTSALELLLAEYEKDQSNSTLSSWVQFPPEFLQTRRLDGIVFSPDMDGDEVCRVVSEVHNQLIQFYKYLSDHSSRAEVQDLFDNLVNMELGEGRHASTCTWDM